MAHKRVRRENCPTKLCLSNQDNNRFHQTKGLIGASSESPWGLQHLLHRITFKLREECMFPQSGWTMWLSNTRRSILIQAVLEVCRGEVALVVTHMGGNSSADFLAPSSAMHLGALATHAISCPRRTGMGVVARCERSAGKSTIPVAPQPQACSVSILWLCIFVAIFVVKCSDSFLCCFDALCYCAHSTTIPIHCNALKNITIRISQKMLPWMKLGWRVEVCYLHRNC